MQWAGYDYVRAHPPTTSKAAANWWPNSTTVTRGRESQPEEVGEVCIVCTYIRKIIALKEKVSHPMQYDVGLGEEGRRYAVLCLVVSEAGVCVCVFDKKDIIRPGGRTRWIGPEESYGHVRRRQSRRRRRFSPPGFLRAADSPELARESR